MFFSKIVALAALALASAQSSTRLQFTNVPGPFTIGKPATISWTGGSGESVTIILREGQSDHLNTIGIIASNVKGTTYSWTPSSALVPGDDYALQITQGIDESNYSGMFSILASSKGATTIYAAVGSATSAIATLTPNATSTVTMHMGTAASASGTGHPMSRNQTMSSATLKPTHSTSSSTTAPSSTSSTGAALAQASAQAFVGLGAFIGAVVYLL